MKSPDQSAGSSHMLLRNGLSRLVLAAGIAIAAVDCGGDNGGTVPPGSGAVEITTSTSGVEQDGDGYSLLFDGGPGRSIGSTETVVLADITSGSHSIQLA